MLKLNTVKNIFIQLQGFADCNEVDVKVYVREVLNDVEWIKDFIHDLEFDADLCSDDVEYSKELLEVAENLREHVKILKMEASC